MKRREIAIWLALAAAGVVVAWSLLSSRIGVLPGEATRSADAAPAGAPDATRPGPEPDFEAQDEDWDIVQEVVRQGRAGGLDSLAMGDVVARVGLSFVGTPYEPGTLEIPGPERLVVNLRALDCVTFVENALVLATLVKTAPDAVVEDREALAAAYRRELAQLRYRGGALSGYQSRLHYFSEWLTDNERKGIVTIVTPELTGADRDVRPLTFMSANPGAYRQIAESPHLLEVIREQESALDTPRWYVPEDRIETAAAGRAIRDGDIIAAKSTLEGLDVAHTGIALWQDGDLHLLHAPLVGDSVEVTPRPLAERLRGIRAQDGILVARPLEPRVGGGAGR